MLRTRIVSRAMRTGLMGLAAVSHLPARAADAAAPQPAASAASAAEMAPIKVRGSAARDVASEGTGDYTSPAVSFGLGDHSARETPNSVSVVTRQRIEDQNLLTIEDAMQYTTAMKVTGYGTTTAAVESRGYTIDHYQIDGVSSLARVYENNFGLAMYDRVEVWRGPSGLMQGAGDPGGTINFVRKRAQDAFGFNAKTAIGSWNQYYGEADVTGPLTADGRLRGRLVAAYTDRGYFTDTAWKHEPLVYGTLEYDFQPDTTLSVGATWQRTSTRPFYGLSSYEDGRFADVSRSTFAGAAWNRDNQQASRSFAELEHRFDGGGKAKLTGVYIDRYGTGEFAWGNSYIDPATGNVEMIPYFSWDRSREVTLDGQVTLPLQWRGLAQEFVLGASYQKLKSSGAYNSSTWGQNGFLQNIYAPDIDVPKPDVGIDAPTHAAQTQSALYGQARIKPMAALTVLAGARLAWFKSQDLDAPENDQSVNAQLEPYAGVIVDVSRDYSVYASYSNIFNPQSDKDFQGQYLAPRKGHQYEVGIKGEHLDGRLNTSLAIYRIEDTGRAITDPEHLNFSIAAGKVRSEGVEAEVTGRLLANWNLTAGYGYNTTRQLVAAPGQEGVPFTTTFPRHTFSLWSDYRFSDAIAKGWSLGAGVKLRSQIYNESDGVRWGQGGYAVYALQAGYRIGAHWNASLTVNNLFDRHYLERPENWTRQVYYGDPRNVMLSVAYTM